MDIKSFEFVIKVEYGIVLSLILVISSELYLILDVVVEYEFFSVNSFISDEAGSKVISVNLSILVVFILFEISCECPLDSEINLLLLSVNCSLLSVKNSELLGNSFSFIFEFETVEISEYIFDLISVDGFNIFPCIIVSGIELSVCSFESMKLSVLSLILCFIFE